MLSPSLLLDLLPRDLRGELCIADVSTRGSELGFRMDPGSAFERHGAIADRGDGRFGVVIADRSRPGDALDDVAGAWGMIAADVPDELRGAAGRAWSRAAAQPHWRDTFGDEAPQVLGLWTGPYSSPSMTRVTERTARETGATCFFCLRGGWNECLTVPPTDTETFLSVTPEGAWAAHNGIDTYPLTGHPDGHDLAVLRVGWPTDRPSVRIPERCRPIRPYHQAALTRERPGS